jgi:glycosyltransferase involved in cell wall biosynthesis
MRILVVHNRYQDPGGEDIVFEQEVKALSTSNTIETLLFQNKKGWQGAVQYLLYPYNVLAGTRLQKKLDEFQPDLVHIHNIHYASGPILFRILQKRNIPSVFTLHNYRLLCPSALLFFKGQRYFNSIGKAFPWDAVFKGVLDGSPVKTFLTAFTYRLHAYLGTWKNITAYLPLTNFAGDLLLKGRLGIKKEQIVVKPNFIEALPNCESTAGNYYIYIGRLSTEKGVEPLIKNFSKDGAPTLYLVGDGPLRSLIPERENIKFLGFKNRDQFTPLLAGAKALVIPSICLEGFPLALQEGMALKKPILISKEVAASEIILDGVNGFLMDPWDYSQTLKNLEERDDLSAIGLAGHELYLKNYTKEKVIERLVEVYKAILEETPSRG